MDWQEWIVGAILLVAVVRAAVWGWRQFCGRKNGGCASCSATECPLKARNRK